MAGVACPSKKDVASADSGWLQSNGRALFLQWYFKNFRDRASEKDSIRSSHGRADQHQCNLIR